MAITSKYAGLPDIGSSILRSDSRASSTNDLDGNDSAIDRHRINPNEARNNFLSDDSNGKASNSWIGTKRAGFKGSGRRIRNGVLEGISADESDIEDEESLERKIARLRREVSEVKEAFDKRSVETKQTNEDSEKGETKSIQTLDSLYQVLDTIEQPRRDSRNHPSTRLIQQLDSAHQPKEEGLSSDAKTAKDDGHVTDSIDSTADYDATHTLSRVSDFDKRLQLLETALGMDSVPLPTQDRGAARAVLPVLDNLDRQVSTILLKERSLDKVSRQIRQMTRESEKLAEARKAAAAQLPSNQSSSDRVRVSTKGGARLVEDNEDLDQTSKINALYGTLSTIDSLSPLLPSVLDRLRSLRAIHADAALASEALSKVESRQTAMAEELQEWKDGLGKVESAMQVGEKSMKENMGQIDGWVKELETRLRKTTEIDNI
ncbi:MAG: hypothetical protein Q9170_005710 [Blastenia crenularia]